MNWWFYTKEIDDSIQNGRPKKQPFVKFLLKICLTLVLTCSSLFSSAQFSHSVMSDSLWPHGLQHARIPCPSPTPGAYSPMSIISVMPSNHLILCCPLLLPPSIFVSIRVFSVSQLFTSGGQSIKSFSFNISPSNEHSGLISFRIYWLDLLAVQGMLKSLLQHHSSKASVLSAQLSL